VLSYYLIPFYTEIHRLTTQQIYSSSKVCLFFPNKNLNGKCTMGSHIRQEFQNTKIFANSWTNSKKKNCCQEYCHFVTGGKKIRAWASESVEGYPGTFAPINSIATECSWADVIHGRGFLLLPTHDLPAYLKLTINRYTVLNFSVLSLSFHLINLKKTEKNQNKLLLLDIQRNSDFLILKHWIFLIFQ
jgi:hypothetical protein